MLQEEQYPYCEVPPGTMPLNLADALEMADFGSCVIKGEPCPAAQTIHPQNEKGFALDCAQCPGRTVTQDEAKKCIAWLKLVPRTT